MEVVVAFMKSLHEDLLQATSGVDVTVLNQVERLEDRHLAILLKILASMSVYLVVPCLCPGAGDDSCRFDSLPYLRTRASLIRIAAEQDLVPCG